MTTERLGQDETRVRESETPLAEQKALPRRTAQEVLEEVIYSPLHWPWKTIALERSSLRDYCQRPLSAKVSIAEFYHENSKLISSTLPELLATQTDADEVRRQFVTRRAAVVKKEAIGSLNIEGSWRPVLTAVAQAIEPELFYGAEIRLLVHGELLLYEPLLDSMGLVKRISESEQHSLERALEQQLASAKYFPVQMFLFIVGCFARNDILLGVRGYRRTLLDAGRLSQAILREAGRLGLKVRPYFEFIDRAIDSAISADGTEEGTLAVIEFGI